MSLSLLPILLVFSTMGVGWWIGDYNGVYSKIAARAADRTQSEFDQQVKDDLAMLSEPQRRFTYHFQLGLASSLAVVLINSLSVTYLIGTSRWVKEVCDAYELEDRFVAESTKIKRMTFPWSIMGVFSILAIVALGAAADPGTLRATTAKWVTPHMLTAMIGSSIIIIAIVVQAMNLQRNAQLIEEVVDEVKQERVTRGLPVE